MNMITVSAPGKLLLFGEHAVLYGRPSIVTALGTRLAVSCEPIGGEPGHVDLSALADARFVSAAVVVVKKEWGSSFPSVKITTKSEFSPLFGFGSSAASAVATVAALGAFMGKKYTEKTLFAMAYKAVLAVQGRGSGFDVAASVYGGTLSFVMAGKLIAPIATPAMPLVIGYTGVKADTVAIMADIAAKMGAQPDRVNRIYDAIAKITDDAKLKMIEGDWQRVGKLMTFNQEYLRDLGVSSQKLEALIEAANGAGAFGAKLSGAGGGDCMVAMVPEEKRNAVEAAIAAVGGQVIHIVPGAPGVRRDP
jgi:mevalonate kinase